MTLRGPTCPLKMTVRGCKVIWIVVLLFIFLCDAVVYSAQDLTSVTIDLTPVEVLLGIVFGVALAMFGYRKFIKTANRT